MKEAMLSNMPSDCLGIVLAGGLSSRMGQDKAELNHFSRTDKQAQNMLSFSQQLLLDSGIKHTVISGDNYQVADQYKQLGPLGGIYSVIEKHKPSAILAIPVDLPLLSPNILMDLKLKGELSQKACFYHDNYLPLYLPINGFSELFFQSAFSQSSEKGRGPSMKQLLANVPHQRLSLKNDHALFNCNTPEQWQQAQHLYLKN